MIRLSFGGGVIESRADFDRRILALLRKNRQALGVACSDPDDVAGCFGELIEGGSAAAGERAVVLLDE